MKMGRGRNQNKETYMELISELFAFASILTPEDFTSVIVSCQMYINGEELPELNEKASVAFAFFKSKLDTEITYKKGISEKRKASVSMRKDRINSSSDTNDVTATNVTKDTNVTKLQNVQNVQFVTFVDEEKESVPSPLSPSPSSPTPLTTTPPIIPQPMKEKEDISLNGVEQEKKSRKSKDYYGSLSEFQRERFDLFWKAYPKKTTKQECADWWNDNKPNDDLLKSILNGVLTYTKSSSVLEGYALDPIRFLKRRRWDDDDLKTPISPPQTKKIDWWSTETPFTH